jgi:NADH dehydrogenase FAD-containing subunit
MAKILVVGGGFGGIVAAESLAKKLGDGHEITLVSRSNKFVFYPALGSTRIRSGHNRKILSSTFVKRWLTVASVLSKARSRESILQTNK